MNPFDNIWNHNYILEQAQIDYHKDTSQAGTGYSKGIV